MNKSEVLNSLELTRNTKEQFNYYESLSNFIDESENSLMDMLNIFPIFATRQSITSFLEKYELYKLILDIPGSILECGVAGGRGIMSFYHFSSIFEPYHYTRKVIGFDTFEGFPSIDMKDKTSNADHMKVGGLKFESYDLLNRSFEVHDKNRVLGHIPKGELVKGDISQTLPKYLEENPHLVVSLLYMDLDLYTPTKDTLELLIERIPKGGVIVFDELNHSDYPGETIALMETLKLSNLRLKRLNFSSMASYAVIGD